MLHRNMQNELRVKVSNDEVSTQTNIRSTDKKRAQLSLPSPLHSPLGRCLSSPSQMKDLLEEDTVARRSDEKEIDGNLRRLCTRSKSFDNKFSDKKFIAQGGCGKVYKCRSVLDNQWYAVKVETFYFKPQAYFTPEEVREVIMNEALVLSKLDHENVCRYYHAWVHTELVSMPLSQNKLESKVALKATSSKGRAANHQPNHFLPRYDSRIYTNDSGSEISSSSFEEQEDIIQVSESPDLGLKSSGSSSEEEEGLGRKCHTDGKRQPSPTSLTASLCTRIDTYIQMALYDGRSLRQWLDERTVVNYTESLRVFQQLVVGLKYIHAQGLIHQDMKPSNVFLTSDFCVKIGDFGLAQSILKTGDYLHPLQYVNSSSFDTSANDEGEDATVLSLASDSDGSAPIMGTLTYCSPEKLDRREYTAATDVYSLGIVLCELFCVFSTQMERSIVLSDLRKGELPSELDNKYPQVALLIRQMLSVDATERPSCESLEDAELFDVLTRRSSIWSSTRSSSSSSVSMNNCDSLFSAVDTISKWEVVESILELEQQEDNLLAVFRSDMLPSDKILEVIQKLQELSDERKKRLSYLLSK